MKKLILITLFLSLLSGASYAQTIKTLNLNTTVPAAFGNYDKLHLQPRGDLTNCDVGTFYVPSSSDRIMYCESTNNFVPLSPLKHTNTDLLTLDPDEGIIAKGTLGTGNTLTTTGFGTRMIWYPRKGAFRAGGISSVIVGPLAGAEWNDANIGNYSAAFGVNNGVQALASTAVAGANHLIPATGWGSLASGWQNIIHAPASVAFGQFATLNATASNSFVFGHYTAATPGVITQADSFIIDGDPATPINVGIGTKTPNQRLHINDVMRIQPRASIPETCTTLIDGSIYVDKNTTGSISTTLCICDGTNTTSGNWRNLREGLVPSGDCS